MSTLKVNNLQVGQDGTAANNYTLYQPASPDGTVRLGYGNAGSVTDILTLKNSKLGIGTNNPDFKFHSNETGGSTIAGLFETNQTDSYISFQASGTTASSTVRIGAVADNLVAFVNGLERLHIAANGHMGLGVTPSAWAANGDFTGLQVKGASLFGRGSGDEDRGGIAVNYYHTGSAEKYIANGNAGRIYLADGNIHFSTAPANSSGAGAAMTLTERLRIFPDGRVSLGANLASYTSDNMSSAADDLVVTTPAGSNGGITIVNSGTSDIGNIFFANGTGETGIGRIQYEHQSNSFAITTNNTVKLKVESGGATTMHVNSASHETFRFTTQGVDEAKLIMKDAGDNDDIVLNTGGDSWFNGGDFGIGTTTPSSNGGRTLEIRDDDTPSIRLNDGNQYMALFQLRGNDLEIRGSNGQLEFYTGNTDGASSSLRAAITSAGHKWTHNGSIFHGSNDVTDFTDAARDTYNNVSIRAGYAGGDVSPTNRTSAIKIYPVGSRSTTTGTLTGGIAWQHLDPNNGSWGSNYGEGAQMWMGAALHDTPGQERDRFNLWMNSGTTGNSNPGNLAIEAYPNGMVRHPKVPAFLAKGGTALVNNTNTIIVGSGTEFNNGSCYSTSNGRFTAPIDGIYHFSFWGLLYPHASGVCNIYYSRNGAQYGHLIQGGADSNSHTSRSGTIMMSMNANDYAELRINRGSNTGVNAYGSQWNMCGFLVG